MKFRRKPVIIEATRWFENGDHPQDDCLRPWEDTGLIPTSPREGAVVRYFRLPGSDDLPCVECQVPYRDHGFIDTREGGHRVCPGDWIITGVEGERYPCKNSVFEKTYEPAEPHAPGPIPGKLYGPGTEFGPMRPK